MVADDELMPPAGTPARRGVLAQSEDRYPGVDRWEHPKEGLRKGTRLIQFDYRQEDLIRKSEKTASLFFTDSQTVLPHVNEQKEVRARDLAESLQVGPYRDTQAGPHLYSQNLVIYRLNRDLLPSELRVPEPLAGFGQGYTRHNVQWGAGGGKQFLLSFTKEELVAGPNPLLSVVAVLPCIEQNHQLTWLAQREQQNDNNVQVTAAVSMEFQRQVQRMQAGTVQRMQAGTVEQRQHAEEIVKLRRARAELPEVKAALKNLIGAPTVEEEGIKRPAQKARRRGPRL